MKKLSYLFLFVFFVSCTSNTIFEEPKDLIPRDSMGLLIQELMIASSAKDHKNLELKTYVNYTPLVYNKFKIDSNRFKKSNFYYASKIDLYKEILEDAVNSLKKQKKHYEDIKTVLDSIKKDSVQKAKIPIKKLDSLDSMPDS